MSSFKAISNRHALDEQTVNLFDQMEQNNMQKKKKGTQVKNATSSVSTAAPKSNVKTKNSTKFIIPAKPASLPCTPAPTYSMDVDEEDEFEKELETEQSNQISSDAFSPVRSRFHLNPVDLGNDFDYTSNPWIMRSAVEMYDILTKPGNKLGIVANRILTKLLVKGFMGGGDGKRCLLGKTKEQRSVQRSAMLRLVPAGVKLMREEMFTNNIDLSGKSSVVQEDEEIQINYSDFEDAGGDAVSTEEETINLQARICHLAVEEVSEAMLTIIFGSSSVVAKAARRAILDNKNDRTVALWTRLANEFVNNGDWNPVNEMEDSRLDTIDPRFPPSKPITPEKLRKLWSDMRSRYTVCYNNYHASGQGLMGEDDGDDEFFEKFIRGNLVFFYMHKIFAGAPPIFMTRDQPAQNQSDVGVTSTKVTAGVGSKRKYIDSYHSAPGSGVVDLTTDEEKERDLNMSKYYATQDKQAQLTSLRQAIESPLFEEHFSPEEKSEMREKYRKFVMSEIFQL